LFMHRKLCFASFVLFLFSLLSVTLLIAADPPWVAKRIPEWSEQDAFLVLTHSPWVGKAAIGLTRLMTASERREGGDMGAQGGGHGGIGLENAGSLVGTGGAIKRPGQGAEDDHLQKLTIRWESALPVRAAEIRANDHTAPELDGEDYAIGVYDVNLKIASIDLKGIEEMVKKVGILKVDGRAEGPREFRPTRVSVIELGGDMATVVYFFPRAAHITAQDERLVFEGQVGRITFAQYFYPAQMQFLGKLEL
jgi:hypothetical protein